MSAFQSSDPALIQSLIKTASSFPSSHASPSAFVKAVSVRAFSLGLTETETTLFLKKQVVTHPGLSDLLSNRSAYRRLVSSCRAAARSSSPAGAADNSLKTSRLTLGRILSPVPVTEVRQTPLEDGTVVEPKLVPVLTPARQIRARATLAILCVEQLKSIQGDKGWNTLMVSYGWLALRTGVSWPTAKAVLGDLVFLGWIREVGGHRPDSARRFKISGRLTREQAQVIAPAHLYSAVGSLAGLNDEPAPTAELIRFITSPAWTYGSDPVGFRNWLVALAQAAGVDPVQLGVTKRALTGSRRVLTLAGMDLSRGDPVDVNDRLIEWGQRTGSFDAAAQAKAAYKAQAAERTAELTRVREGRAKAKQDLESAFGPVGLIPAADAPVEKRNAWLQGAAQALSHEPITEDRRKALRYELTRRLKLRGFRADTLIRVVNHLLGHAPAFLPEETIPASSEAPAVKQQWLQEAVAAMAGKVMQPVNRAAFCDEIFSKLRRRGYDKGKAKQISDLIVGDIRLAEAA